MRFVVFAVGGGAVERLGAVERGGLLVYVYVYMCAHKETGCKGTKIISYMQIYEEKSAENLNFARDLRGFEGIEMVDWENYSDYRSIIAIIVLGLGNHFKGNQKSGSRLLEQPDV